MKKLLLFIAAAGAALGAGFVQQSVQRLGNTGNFSLTFYWTGDSINGSVPTTLAQLGQADLSAQGMRVLSVEVIPGTPAPTANYSVQLIDSFGGDLQGGQMAALSATAPAFFPPFISAPPIVGAFSLVLTGNSVASAQGRVVVFFGSTQTILTTPGITAFATNPSIQNSINLISGSTTNAYDARLLVSGGSNGNNGSGTLGITAAQTTFSGSMENKLSTSLSNFPYQNSINNAIFSWDYLGITPISATGGAYSTFSAEMLMGPSLTGTGNYVGGVIGAETNGAAGQATTLIEAFNPMLTINSGYLGVSTAIELDVNNQSNVAAMPPNGLEIILGNSAFNGANAMQVGSNNSQVWQIGLVLAKFEQGIVMNVPSTGVSDGILLQGGSAPSDGFFVIRPNDNTAPLTPAVQVDNATGTPLFTVDKAGDLVAKGFTSFSQVNYIGSETGANNAIAGTVPNPPALSAGMIVNILLAHSLQAGANTFNYNGGGAVSIKSHLVPTNNIATPYVSQGMITLMFNGTSWLDLSQ